MKALGLNKRESILVLVLLLLLIGFGIYKLVYQPLVVKMTELRLELEQKAGERADAEIKISAIPRLETEISTAEVLALNNAPPFFSEITQENMIVMLSELSTGTSFKVKAYSYTEPSISKIAVVGSKGEKLEYAMKELVEKYILKYGNEKQKEELVAKLSSGEAVTAEEEIAPEVSGDAAEANEGETEDTAEEIVPQVNDGNDYGELEEITVNLNFESTYFQLISYLRKLEEYDKKIIVSNIGIAGSDGASLSGVMTLDFYLLPKLFKTDRDKKESMWELDIPSGKDNPFGYSAITNGTAAAGEGAVTDESEISIDQVSYRNTDFFLIARPSNSDMPALTLGEGGDATGETYIKEAFSGEKNVTIEFTEENGTYYYTYGTDTRTYPESGRQEFTPKRTGIVNLVIYSRKRTSDSDTNIFNVTVVNNTSLTLMSVVDGDDNERPRINML